MKRIIGFLAGTIVALGLLYAPLIAVADVPGVPRMQGVKNGTPVPIGMVSLPGNSGTSTLINASGTPIALSTNAYGAAFVAKAMATQVCHTYATSTDWVCAYDITGFRSVTMWHTCVLDPLADSGIGLQGVATLAAVQALSPDYSVSIPTYGRDAFTRLPGASDMGAGAGVGVSGGNTIYNGAVAMLPSTQFLRIDSYSGKDCDWVLSFSTEPVDLLGAVTGLGGIQRDPATLWSTGLASLVGDAPGLALQIGGVDGHDAAAQPSYNAITSHYGGADPATNALDVALHTEGRDYSNVHTLRSGGPLFNDPHGNLETALAWHQTPGVTWSPAGGNSATDVYNEMDGYAYCTLVLQLTNYTGTIGFYNGHPTFPAVPYGRAVDAYGNIYGSGAAGEPPVATFTSASGSYMFTYMSPSPGSATGGGGSGIGCGAHITTNDAGYISWSFVRSQLPTAAGHALPTYVTSTSPLSVSLGIQAKTTQPTASSDGTRVTALGTPDGAQYVRLGGPVNWTYSTSTLVTTAQAIQSTLPGASLSYYVGSLSIAASSSTVPGTNAIVQSCTSAACGGTCTTIWQAMLTTSTPWVASFDQPIKVAANTSLCWQLNQAGAYKVVNVAGFTAP